MDRAEVWKLQDELMPPFMDQREFCSSTSQSHYSFSSDEQFDSSFNSSASYFDGCSTPSRSGSFGMNDFGGPYSWPTIASNDADSPIDDPSFYSMASINYTASNEADKNSSLFATPCHRTLQDHRMMNDNCSTIDKKCGHLELQHTLNGLPETVYGGLPEILCHEMVSPVPIMSSSNEFVVPSQTFIAEPYRPKTPKNMPRAILGSPLQGRGQCEENINHFISPREMQFHIPSSSTSSGSPLARTPSNQTLESSVALHCIQSINDSCVSEKSKGLSNITFKKDVVKKGEFTCDFPGCKAENGLKRFKRREHLKRHKITHTDQQLIECPYCLKKFAVGRKDNYKHHLKLHSRWKKSSRTTFFEEAAELVNSWKTKKSSDNDKKLDVPDKMYRVSTRKTRARGLVKTED